MAAEKTIELISRQQAQGAPDILELKTELGSPLRDVVSTLEYQVSDLTQVGASSLQLNRAKLVGLTRI